MNFIFKRYHLNSRIARQMCGLSLTDTTSPSWHLALLSPPLHCTVISTPCFKGKFGVVVDEYSHFAPNSVQSFSEVDDFDMMIVHYDQVLNLIALEVSVLWQHLFQMMIFLSVGSTCYIDDLHGDRIEFKFNKVFIFLIFWSSLSLNFSLFKCLWNY